MAYDGVDFYGVDDLLTDEQRDVRLAARRWVDERFLPGVEANFRAGTFPMELVPEMGELGFYGPQLSGWGCPGLGYTTYGVLCQELERGDSGLRSFASVQGSLVMYPIHRFGSDAQRERWLPRLATGEAIGCFGLTEPDHGSDPGSMRTRAEDRGGAYVLRGAKLWITNGSIADVAVVWAKLDGVVRGFLVERGTPGFTSRALHNKHSLRASVTSELVLDEVVVPHDAILPGVAGLKGPLSCLTSARYGIAWGALGAAQACYDVARAYALEREQFGQPLGAFQLVQQKLVAMLRQITLGQLLAWRLGALQDAGTATPEQVSLAKLNNVDIALQIARSSRDLLGAAGIVDEFPVMRHMANLESVITYEGTHDIHTLILGRWITGIQAFTR